LNIIDGTPALHIAEFIIGRAFARPGDSCGLRCWKHVRKRNLQDLTDLIEACRADATGTFFIFLNLLIRDPQPLTTLYLGYLQHPSALAYPAPDSFVDAIRTSDGFHRAVGCLKAPEAYTINRIADHARSRR
jgi:hypothetical protein